MTTAMLEKRIKSLEEEVEILKQEIKRSTFAISPIKKGIKAKKLPAGLRQALREVAEGKLSGPFATGEDLKAYFERR